MATQRHLINTDKGAVNGVASLDAGAKVPLVQLETGANGLAVKVSGKLVLADLPTGTAQDKIPVLGVGGKLDIAVIPNGLDEMEFHNDLASFPATGEADMIYVDRSTDKSYLWTGSAYVERVGGNVSNPTTNITMPNSTTGLVLISPNGTSYIVLVDDDGALTTTTPVV